MDALLAPIMLSAAACAGGCACLHYRKKAEAPPNPPKTPADVFKSHKGGMWGTMGEKRSTWS
jgi:hypothetical protein